MQLLSRIHNFIQGKSLSIYLGSCRVLQKGRVLLGIGYASYLSDLTHRR